MLSIISHCEVDRRWRWENYFNTFFYFRLNKINFFQHLRIQFEGLSVSLIKSNGTPTTIEDLMIKNGDVLEIYHRHGKPCRFCKRNINIKLRAENGYTCSYKIDKRNPLESIISGFAQLSLTSVENLRLSYQGKRFNLVTSDGNLITPADLKMGDWDQIDIVHQR